MAHPVNPTAPLTFGHSGAKNLKNSSKKDWNVHIWQRCVGWSSSGRRWRQALDSNLRQSWQSIRTTEELQIPWPFSTGRHQHHHGTQICMTAICDSPSKTTDYILKAWTTHSALTKTKHMIHKISPVRDWWSTSLECIGVGGGGAGEAIIWDRRLQVCHYACSSVYCSLYFINFLFDSVW